MIVRSAFDCPQIRKKTVILWSDKGDKIYNVEKVTNNLYSFDMKGA